MLDSHLSNSEPSRAGSAEVAKEIHLAWDQAWPAVEQSIQNQGLEILCNEGCHGCCFDFKSCSESEALLICDHIQQEFSAERQEHFRSRVESAAGCCEKRQHLGLSYSADQFERSGGIECPFLERGRCAIYPVRPLSCRSMVLATSADSPESADRELCRKCPASVTCLEAQRSQIELQTRMDEQEMSRTASAEPSQPRRQMIAERLSGLWKDETLAPSTHQMTDDSWGIRLASRKSWFDQTWRDDGFNWEVLKFPVVLPEEGEYPPDLVVLGIEPETHEVYGEPVRTNVLNELRVLYKLLPGGRFDWTQRTFETDESTAAHIVWMGDSIQERLMMWDAAIRCSGDVLCGGLGMGIFPQFALSLPQVASVHVVEMDPAIMSLIQTNWASHPWRRMNECSVEESPIEEYLTHTDRKFDTIYIDTWDALTYDYLPHVNYLKELARERLKPGGEILLWGYDMMVRFAMNQADHILKRRDYFLNASEQQLRTLERQQPLFHRMIDRLRHHSSCSREEFLTATYCAATTWTKDLGRLSLDRLG
jgi:Fe-S-cluster containining protein